MEKIKAVSIWLHQAEGRTPLPEPVTLTGPHVWSKSMLRLTEWGLDCEPDMLGVLKTDFKVTYEQQPDEEEPTTYEGTFGLTRTDSDLADHMRTHLRHLLRPEVIRAHRDRGEQWAREAQEFLDKFEIGPQA